MVKFANGTQIETIAVYGDNMRFQNEYRETLEFRVDECAVSFDELKAIYTDSKALSEIEIVDGDSHSLHLNYSIPVELSLREIDGVQTLSMKIAQRSEAELERERQAAEITNTQLALIELAEMIVG